MTLIADVFPKLQNAKDVVRQMSKKSCFRRPFDKKHGKRSQPLLKSVMADPLSYLLITAKETELQKPSLNDI